MTVVLWHLELSPYSEKARWALDFKAIPHERRVPIPGLHGLRAMVLTRGAQRRLPVLVFGGRRIGDSTAIIAALEEHTPDPPLYPADPEVHARALALEDWFDEQLAPGLRRFLWHHTLPDIDAAAAAIFTSPHPVRERWVRTTAPVARKYIRRDYDVTDESAEQGREEIVAAMDRLESELQPSGYLVGAGFTVADLAAASLFTPVLAPPGRPYVPATLTPPLMELREELSARPGGVWVAEMYARHRGQSAEVVG